MYDNETRWVFMRIERELELKKAQRLAQLGFEPADPFRGLARLRRLLTLGRRPAKAPAAQAGARPVRMVRGPSRRAVRGS